MITLVVVEDPADWPLKAPGATVVSAQDYLSGEKWAHTRNAKVFNLCRSYQYQSIGYYVSLLAAARGHKPLPSVATLVDFRLVSLVRLADYEMEELINSSLAPLQSTSFTLSIYFGHNTAKRYDRLCSRIFRLFPAPLIRCSFAKEEDTWRLRSIKPISAGDIPKSHHAAMLEFGRAYFADKPVPQAGEVTESRFHVAILWNPDEPVAPSDPKALQRFKKAAERLDMSVELITKDDYGRLAEFDALFIRETTNVNHHTFRFARRAQAEGLVVIDDPDSILRCSNKVFLAELLNRGKVATPRTVIVHEGNLADLPDMMGFPCILKQPDSAFSRGVVKVENLEQLMAEGKRMLEDSELVIAQEFMPTAYDWRVGVMDGEPLFVCRYHMAKEHWQVVKREEGGKAHWGKTETVPLWQAPPKVIRAALAASNLIGDGLYGVDLKEVKGKCYIMEVNDNPDINAGDEDAELRDELYNRVMGVFLKRLEKRKERKGSKS